MEHDAPQCGFCTSGQLMSAKALPERSNPHPTADEVRAAMTGNICRCSNYNRYVEAALAAAGTSRSSRRTSPRSSSSTPRGDKPSHASEDRRPRHPPHRRRRARHRQGHLYAATSSCPACSTRACCAARIRTRAFARIDVSKALGAARRQGRSHARELHRSSGARARSPAGGSTSTRSRRSPSSDATPSTIRCALSGEPVAAVAAVDRHIAEEALRLITVDYEVLPFVLDPEEALKPGRA